MLYKEDVNVQINYLWLWVKHCVDQAYHDVVKHEALCTSGNDRKHKDGSFHYQNLAWDFRTRKNNWGDFLDPATTALLKTKIKFYLGPLFQVVVEPTHIHVEFDPRYLGVEIGSFTFER